MRLENLVLKVERIVEQEKIDEVITECINRSIQELGERMKNRGKAAPKIVNSLKSDIDQCFNLLETSFSDYCKERERQAEKEFQLRLLELQTQRCGCALM